jgi:hypothetical protein
LSIDTTPAQYISASAASGDCLFRFGDAKNGLADTRDALLL